MGYELVSGDTASALQVRCRDNQTKLPIDLTGATVRLKWMSGANIVSRTMTIVDAVQGVARYQFATGELEPGDMRFEVEITDSGGKIMRSLDLIVESVRRAL